MLSSNSQNRSDNLKWQVSDLRDRSTKTVCKILHPIERPELKRLAQQFLTSSPKGLQTISATKSSSVVLRQSLDGKSYYLKSFHIRNSLDKIKRQFRLSRAQNSANGAAILKQAGFNSVEPCVIVEFGSWPFFSESLSVTEQLPDNQTLRCWIKTSSKAPDNTIEKQELTLMRLKIATCLGRELGVMHQRGVFHPDTNIGNILFGPAVEDPNFIWLDTEGVRRLGQISLRLRANNLKQLAKLRGTSRAAERKIFWQSYVAASEISELSAAKLKAMALEMTVKNIKLYRSKI